VNVVEACFAMVVKAYLLQQKASAAAAGVKDATFAARVQAYAKTLEILVSFLYNDTGMLDLSKEAPAFEVLSASDVLEVVRHVVLAVAPGASVGSSKVEDLAAAVAEGKKLVEENVVKPLKSELSSGAAGSSVKSLMNVLKVLVATGGDSDVDAKLREGLKSGKALAKDSCTSFEQVKKLHAYLVSGPANKAVFTQASVDALVKHAREVLGMTRTELKLCYATIDDVEPKIIGGEITLAIGDEAGKGGDGAAAEGEKK